MRLVLDTNILISALIRADGAANTLYSIWKDKKFQLISHQEQLEEFRIVSRYAKLTPYFMPREAGRMLNELEKLSLLLDDLPDIAVSQDPKDNFILAMAAAGKAHYLVTGDKRHLLNLKKIEQTKIVSLSEIIKLLGH